MRHNNRLSFARILPMHLASKTSEECLKGVFKAGSLSRPVNISSRQNTQNYAFKCILPTHLTIVIWGHLSSSVIRTKELQPIKYLINSVPAINFWTSRPTSSNLFFTQEGEKEKSRRRSSLTLVCDASGDALSHDPKYCPDNCTIPDFTPIIYAHKRICVLIFSLFRLPVVFNLFP
jgi:hypothetical protein